MTRSRLSTTWRRTASVKVTRASTTRKKKKLSAWGCPDTNYNQENLIGILLVVSGCLLVCCFACMIIGNEITKAADEEENEESGSQEMGGGRIREREESEDP